MISVFDFLKDFAWNMKVSSFKNKHTPKDNRDAAFDYFENKASKALSKNDILTFEKVLSVFTQRFGIVISNSIKDLEEKERTKNLFISYGEKSIIPLKEYIKNDYFIAYPISILNELIGENETLNYLNSILTTDDTLFDDKLVEKRIDVLKYFEGKTMSDVLKKSLTFLNDSDDRLVIAAIRFIRNYEFSKADDTNLVKDTIIQKFLNEDTSVRLRLELINIISEQNWKVSGYKKRLEEILPTGYYITAQGFLRSFNKAVKV